LADLNEQAQSRLDLIIEQMKAAEGVTEDLKATGKMAWGGAMNSSAIVQKKSSKEN